MRARDGSQVSHSDYKASPGHEDDLRPSQHAQPTGEDLGQTGHCPAQQLWLGQAMGAWAELRDSTQDKANRPLLFSRFTQLFPRQPEPKLCSCAQQRWPRAQPSPALPGGPWGLPRALTSASKGNITCKNQGQSLLNSQPMQRFLLRAEHLLNDTGTTTEPS